MAVKLLATAAREVSVPSEQGRYHDLYTAFAAAARGESVQVPPEQVATRSR